MKRNWWNRAYDYNRFGAFEARILTSGRYGNFVGLFACSFFFLRRVRVFCRTKNRRESSKNRRFRLSGRDSNLKGNSKNRSRVSWTKRSFIFILRYRIRTRTRVGVVRSPMSPRIGARGSFIHRRVVSTVRIEISTTGDHRRLNAKQNDSDARKRA